jgi:N-acetylglucosaminyl-diphospho-decaprenol L-rhamnosyltransferase
MNDLSEACAIVVHYAGIERTRRCLTSLAAQDLDGLRVILVDHSEASEGASLVTGLPRTSCVRPVENRGFAAGVNAGLAADSAACVLLLNPDAHAEPTWARRMVEALGASPRAGMAACRVLGRDGRLDSAGLAVGRGGMGILRGHRRDARVSVAALDATPLLGPTGAAAAYRRDALDAIDGFPEQYFLYYEDLEVAWRLRARGWGCAWLDEALVVHDHVSGAGAAKRAHLRRSRRLFRARNFSPAEARRTRGAATLEDLAALTRVITRVIIDPTRRLIAARRARGS